ncbi:MAG: sulfate ABC transporter permease [Rubrobacteraceae bacterium]|uniref:sulfate ABC transporter permease n=1 Tax=Rubrobacter calidifluminis TaxID=1392640 RepID=UPI0023625F78|nr:sulfate ABC transporter permease subunit [Rubrobacter calidifluminis]MBX6765150.1 sulfate ABC transporter permease [Rubrobacteraceae bacterium]
MISRLALRAVALGYLALLLVFPVAMVFRKAFEEGAGTAWRAVTNPAALHALWLTLLATAIAVVVNTLFGILCAIVLVRHRFPGRGLLNAILDLPLAISPVVVGLALYTLYGQGSPVGDWLLAHGIKIIFSVPGIVLATIFISLPFVVREVMPVLQEIGTEQEQAAATLGASPTQTFLLVTLPAIRQGVAYGVVLTTARAIGEFGAVSVVSGRISGLTETMTVYVQDRFQNFDLAGAYAASVVLALIAVATLLLTNAFKPEEER